MGVGGPGLEASGAGGATAPALDAALWARVEDLLALNSQAFGLAWSSGQSWQKLPSIAQAMGGKVR